MARNSGATLAQSTVSARRAFSLTIVMAASRTLAASGAMGLPAASAGPASRRRLRAVTLPPPGRISTPNTSEVASAGTGSVTTRRVHAVSPRSGWSVPFWSSSIFSPASIRSHSEAPPFAPAVCTSAARVTGRPRYASAGTLVATVPKPVLCGFTQRRVIAAPAASVAFPFASIAYACRSVPASLLSAGCGFAAFGGSSGGCAAAVLCRRIESARTVSAIVEERARTVPPDPYDNAAFRRNTRVEDRWAGIAFIETGVKSRRKKGAWTAMPNQV